MAPPGLNPDGACTDFEKWFLTHTGSWPDQQEDRAYTELGYPIDVEHQDFLDESNAPASSYPPGLLDTGDQAPNTAPYFFPDLNEAARQLNQGQTTATPIAPIASEPFTHVRRRFPTPPLSSRNGYTNLDHVIDPLLSANPFVDPSIHYTQEEALSQAQVDEAVRRSFAIQAPDVPGNTVRHHHVGTVSTADGGLDNGMPTLGQLGQHAFTNADSGIGGPATVQSDSVHLSHQVGNQNSPEISSQEREATVFDTSTFRTPPQLVVTPAVPLLQRYSDVHLAFNDTTYGHIHPHLEHGDSSVDLEGYFIRDDSAGPGQGCRATRQHFGAQNYDEYFTGPQGSFVTLSRRYRQHQPGSQTSYETPFSSSDYYFRHSQPGFDYTSAGANQATPADSIANSFDGASDGIPPPARPVLGMKRRSDNSFLSTQQSPQWYYESNEPDLSSPLATTPSQANPVKKQRVSGASHSRAGNSRALDNLVGRDEFEVVSPTTNPAGVSRQVSGASAGEFSCEVHSCTKTFDTRAGLRHHAETHNPKKTSRHECPDCSRGFRYPKDVKRHQRSQHAAEDTRVMCQYCEHRLSREDNLVRHHSTCTSAPPSSAAGNQ